ncbi:MAG: toxin-antitoxin system HicB family antitoxin [Pseudomonadota bacterium]
MPMDNPNPTGGSSTNASCIVSARLPKDVHALVRLAAAENHQSVSRFISQLLRERVAVALT